MNTLRKIFFTVAISLGTISVQAQDSLYREALKEYINVRPDYLVEINVKEVTSGINNRVLLGFNQDKLDSLLKKYHDEQLLDDFLDCIFPSFQGIVSLEDLKELTALMQTPEEPNYYDSKGEILYRKGDKKGAKDMWQKVVSLDPDFANAHNSTLYFLLYGKKRK